MPIKDYSTDPDLNVSISGINIAEGCPPSGINNAIRQLMADVKEESEAVSEAVSEASTALETFAEAQAAKDAEHDAKFDKYLPLSGGTMTGSIAISPTVALRKMTSDSELSIQAGTSYNDGGMLTMFGVDAPSNPGKIFLYPRNKDGSYVPLELSPDGTAMWNYHNILTSAGGTLIAPGMVIVFAGDSTPSGFLLCNGAAVSRTTYAALFAAIGTIYGTGDGSTTFNLPDLRGRYIEGQNASPVGSYWNAGLPNITGVFGGLCNYQNKGTNSMSGAFYSGGWIDFNVGGGSTVESIKGMFSASRSNSIYGRSGTVQPPAVTMRYYIKY